MDSWFLILLPIMAFLYAMVGHGGASAYLALMALFSFAPEVMKPTALVLNLFVAGISFISFYKAGYFKLNLFLVFALTSIPMSYLGGSLEVDQMVYKKILGALLLIAVLRMLGVFGRSGEMRKASWAGGLIIGGAIGFLSGLIGIGGGIILSPIILILGWGNVKETAAVSSLFIWANSLAGIIGQFSIGITLASDIWVYVLLAVLGGLLGGIVGSYRIGIKQLNVVLAIVLVLASVKLLFF